MTKFVVGFIGTPDHLGTACLPSSMNQGLASVRKDFFFSFLFPPFSQSYLSYQLNDIS